MRSKRMVAMAVLGTAMILVSACGREGKQQDAAAKPTASKTATFTGDPEGPYCKLTLKREVEQIKTDSSHPKSGDPAIVKNESDYLVYLKDGKKTAPSEIKSSFDAFADWYLTTVGPILQKYNFNEDRFGKEATPAEKKAMDNEPAAADKGFTQVLKYESQVCGISGPADADVKFTGSKSSAVCVAYRKDQAAHDAWQASDFSPAKNKAFFTGRVATLDEQDRAAVADGALPAAVRTAIHRYDVHYKNGQLPVLVKFNYDWAGALEHGTADERHAITDSGPDIRDDVALSSAYFDQVCAEQNG